jgi:hypothetical protein
MNGKLEFPEVEVAVSEVSRLLEPKTESEAQIATSLRGLAEAKEKLVALRAEARTNENAEYLKAAKKAWRASIKAHELSIVAFRGDTVSYDAEIDAIIKRVPEARQDN